MEQTILKEVVKEAANNNQFSLGTIVIILFIIMWAVERMYKIRAGKSDNSCPTWKDFNKQLEKKSNKEDCSSFKKRIGLETDINTKDIDIIKTGISEIKEGVAFIKGKVIG